MRARKWVTDPQAAHVHADFLVRSCWCWCPRIQVVSRVSQLTSSSCRDVVPGGLIVVMTKLLSVIFALISSHAWSSSVAAPRCTCKNKRRRFVVLL